METIIVKTQKDLDEIKEIDDVQIEIRSKEAIRVKKVYKNKVEAHDSSKVWAYDYSKVIDLREINKGR